MSLTGKISSITALIFLLWIPHQTNAREKIFKIGILSESPSPTLDGFYEGLRDHRLIEGKNVVYIRRFTGPDVQIARQLAHELVAENVDVIFARASTFVEPARQETSNIPIVFANHNDPVGVGHAQSLAHPGGNITGVSQMATEVSIKLLQLLQEMLPNLKRLAIITNPTTPTHGPVFAAIETTSRNFGVAARRYDAKTEAEIEDAFAHARKDGQQAVVVLTSPLTLLAANIVGASAVKYQLPTACGVPKAVEAGALLSYGPNLKDLGRHAADYVFRILIEGEHPADMPIEQPTTFDLTINKTSAVQLNLTIPDFLYVQADRVIQ